MKKESAVIFLTGLSGSGKTTLAKELIVQLNGMGTFPVWLDGDEIRKTIQLFAFDEDSRKQHNLKVGAIASSHEAQGHVVIVSLISPYADIRNEIRLMCRNFIEVYLSTELQVCIERDPKGLYEKALKGEIKDFTGISAPYFAPTHPELVLDTALLSIDECTGKILKLLSK